VRGSAETLDDYREEVARILASKTFAASRQIQDFLRFTSELSFEGRTQIDQAEIALKLLRKSAAFNPVEDASVRRIATLTRQKLGQYYETEGTDDRVIVTLPHRSYLPAFAVVKPVFVAEDVDTAPVPVEKKSARLPSVAPILILAALGVLAWPFWREREASPGPPADSLTLTTQKGEISGPINYVEGKGIYLGPKVRAGEFNDLVVRMRFSPERSTQQGGLMLFQNLDNYVRLGRVFNSRVCWEFDAERNGQLLRPAGTWTYDPLGQDGSPIWLCIRRNGDTYRGMTSSDGRTWRVVGNALAGAGAVSDGRLAVYGMNGINEAAGLSAIFDQMSNGIQFGALPEETPASGGIPGWNLTSSCGAGVKERIDGGGLHLSFANAEPCGWTLTHPAPAADWEVGTRLDFSPVGGAQAGLTLSGEGGTRLRFVRSANNGGIVTVEIPARRIVRSVPDYPGHPPIEMRLESKGGELTAKFSRDGTSFTSLPLGIRTDEIGRELQYGLEFYLTSWNQVNPVTTTAGTRFEYIREEFKPLPRFMESHPVSAPAISGSAGR
jgi:hypothetical protein